MSKNVVLGIVAGLVLGGIIGYGSASMKEDVSDGSSAMSGMSHGASTATNDLASLTGEAYDKKFIELMIEHHQGAIDMANLSDSRAKHQEIRTLSDDIVSAQVKEIEMMKSWLMQWGY